MTSGCSVLHFNIKYPDVMVNFSVAVTGGQYQSWFKGKKIIPYKKFGEFKSSFDSEYAEFIIGYDTDSCCSECTKQMRFNFLAERKSIKYLC